MLRVGEPIRISIEETRLRVSEFMEEVDEFLGADTCLTCYFSYGPQGMSVHVSDVVSQRSYGWSIAQNPSAQLLLYQKLVRSGRYVAPIRQQRSDMADLLIQIEETVSSDEAIVAWRAMRDRSLVRRLLAKLNQADLQK